jgi:hypothetical protein
MTAAVMYIQCSLRDLGVITEVVDAQSSIELGVSTTSSVSEKFTSVATNSPEPGLARRRTGPLR